MDFLNFGYILGHSNTKELLFTEKETLSHAKKNSAKSLKQ